jgi:uncharacterized protein
MIARRLESNLLKSLSFFPAVGLLGARQVGKTTLARALAEQVRASIFLDLERPSDRVRLQEPELFFRTVRDRLVVLDEVQVAPEIFSVLRPEIDSDRRPGRFLILGSASPGLLRQSSESLAGRIAYHELSPLLLSEVGGGFESVDLLWSRGGFPLSLSAPSDALSFEWRMNYIRRFLERDLPQLGVATPAETMHRFWRMLAHHHGQLLNSSQLGASLGVAHTTIARYLDTLVGALVVRRLEPLQVNVGKRLVKSPKIYLRDSGLLHALLGVPTLQELLGHPIAGPSWEGFVLEQVIGHLPPGTDTAFYRTAAGAELDLVVSRGKRRIGFEMKLSAAPRPQRGFWNALEDLGVHEAYILAPVQEGFPLATSVRVISPLELPSVLGQLDSPG